MPRLPVQLLHQARNSHPLLPPLVRVCRDLSSAQNELRWLREHAVTTSGNSRRTISSRERRQLLRSYCEKRARGVPLQYIIGNQPFGDLEVLCRPGVLIPRVETERWTSRIAVEIAKRFTEVQEDRRLLRVLDVCTGSGCIALYLHALLYRHFSDLELLGLDLSTNALSLAQSNISYNISKGLLDSSATRQIRFSRADLFGKQLQLPRVDVLVSNPPYISCSDFNNGETSRSTRTYEPKMALVPPTPPKLSNAHEYTKGDLFYPRILDVASSTGARLVAMEVGGMRQAFDVVHLVRETGAWRGVEVWRDWVDAGSNAREEVSAVHNWGVAVRGEGHGRVVVCWC